MWVEVKLVGRDGTGSMVVRERDVTESMMKVWRAAFRREKVETDSQAAHAAERMEVRIGDPKTYGAPIKTIPVGTPFKEARRMIQIYRQDRQAFGKLWYDTNWEVV